MSDRDYLEWCYRWISECLRVLSPGGSLFLYNLPKWNIRLASFLLDRGMHFRDWIAIDIKLGLPIPNRLYPSHYSLLYFTGIHVNNRPGVQEGSAARNFDNVS